MPIIEPPEIIIPEPGDVLTTLREFSGRLFVFNTADPETEVRMSPCDPSVWPTVDVGVDRAAPWQDITGMVTTEIVAPPAFLGPPSGYRLVLEQASRWMDEGTERDILNPASSEGDDDVAFFDSVEAAESEERPIQARLDEAGRVSDVVGPAAVPWAAQQLHNLLDLPLLGADAIAGPVGQSGRAISALQAETGAHRGHADRALSARRADWAQEGETTIPDTPLPNPLSVALAAWSLFRSQTGSERQVGVGIGLHQFRIHMRGRTPEYARFGTFILGEIEVPWPEVDRILESSASHWHQADQAVEATARQWEPERNSTIVHTRHQLMRSHLPPPSISTISISTLEGAEETLTFTDIRIERVRRGVFEASVRPSDPTLEAAINDRLKYFSEGSENQHSVYLGDFYRDAIRWANSDAQTTPVSRREDEYRDRIGRAAQRILATSPLPSVGWISGAPSNTWPKSDLTAKQNAKRREWRLRDARSRVDGLIEQALDAHWKCEPWRPWHPNAIQRIWELIFPGNNAPSFIKLQNVTASIVCRAVREAQRPPMLKRPQVYKQATQSGLIKPPKGRCEGDKDSLRLGSRVSWDEVCQWHREDEDKINERYLKQSLEKQYRVASSRYDDAVAGDDEDEVARLSEEKDDAWGRCENDIPYEVLRRHRWDWDAPTFTEEHPEALVMPERTDEDRRKEAEGAKRRAAYVSPYMSRRSKKRRKLMLDGEKK